MKQEILRKLMLIVVLLTSVNAFSYDFEVEGYYYNIISDDDSTVEITNDGEGGVYSGEVVIPNTVVYNDKIYTTVAIGEYAFVGCSELSSITIPNTIVEIKIGAFADTWNLTTIICNAKTPPTMDDLFLAERKEAVVVVPFESVMAYKNAPYWEYCTFESHKIDGIYYVAISENEAGVTSDSEWNSYSGNVVIPSEIVVDEKTYKVTSIEPSAFRVSTELTSVAIPNTIVTIGEYAFAGCSGLSEITIPNSVTEIENSVFSGCSGLKSIEISENVVAFGDYAFSNCSGLSGILEIPSSVISLGTKSFYGTNYNMCRILNETPPTIKSNTFSNKISLVLVPAGSKDVYKNADVWGNYTIVAEGSCDIEVTNSTAGSLSNTIFIQERKNLSNITSLTVHGTLNAADMEVINTSMTSLLYLDIYDTDVTDIPMSAFSKPILLNVKLPKNLKTICASAFYGCVLLNSVSELPKTLESIGASAFNYCPLSGNLLIPENVQTIDYYAFANTNIESVDFSNAKNLKTINPYAFNECKQIKSVDLRGATNLTSLGGYSFANCGALTTLLFNDELKSIEGRAFMGCVSLYDVSFPSSIEQIGTFSFARCSNLKNIDFSKAVNLQDIKTNAFYYCENLSIIDLNKCSSLRTIESESFSECIALETVNFPKSLESIGSRAFENCANLMQLCVPCTTPPAIENNAEPFYGVDNSACVLSIPSDNLFEYYSANYWGGFVDIENKSEIKIKVSSQDEGDDASSEETDACQIYFKKHTIIENVNNLQLNEQINHAVLNNSTYIGHSKAITADGQSLFVGNGEVITFYMNPEDGKEIESVIYNDEDVTSQLVNNTYTTSAVGENPMTSFVVNLRNQTVTNIKDIVEDKYENADLIEYYNLQGVKVDNPNKGFYIKRVGNKTYKVVL